MILEVVQPGVFTWPVISQELEFLGNDSDPEPWVIDGTWTIETTVPKPGYYEVLCDFMPKGGSAQFLNASFEDRWLCWRSSPPTARI